MSEEEVINQLESLKDNSVDFMKHDEDGENGVWAKDIKALNIAIEAVNENDRLKQEVIYFAKRAVQAERLLKENECFCPVLQRNEIRDFLRS
jgi:3-hydroxyacyl-CoA dehydrogenase